jgi:hypothetical protein
MFTKQQQQRRKSYFVLLIETYSPAIRGERIVAFPLQQWLCERSTILRYTVSVVLFSSLLHPQWYLIRSGYAVAQ